MIESTMTDLQLQLKHIQATYTNRNTGFIQIDAILTKTRFNFRCMIF